MLHKQYEGYFLTIENESTCTYKNFFYQCETNVSVTYNFEAYRQISTFNAKTYECQI